MGRSCRPLCTRIGEHRRHYYSILNNKSCSWIEDDESALGAHLHRHGFRDRDDFDNVYEVCVLEVCSPRVLEVKEHINIHRTNSLSPNGINVSNPFCMPLLYK